MTDEPVNPDEDTSMRDDTTTDTPAENIVHFNPWRDFNDAAPQIIAEIQHRCAFAHGLCI